MSGPRQSCRRIELPSSACTSLMSVYRRVFSFKVASPSSDNFRPRNHPSVGITSTRLDELGTIPVQPFNPSPGRYVTFPGHHWPTANRPARTPSELFPRIIIRSDSLPLDRSAHQNNGNSLAYWPEIPFDPVARPTTLEDLITLGQCTSLQTFSCPVKMRAVRRDPGGGSLRDHLD